MPIYRKELHIRHTVDVFIAGGGPAGFAAAVACARMGKRVFLAEAHGSFGGAGTVGLVPEFMRFGDGINFLSGGIGREIRDALFTDRSNAMWAYCIKVEDLKRLYDRMAIEAGFQFSFFTQVTDVIMGKDGRVQYAVLSAKSGLFAVQAEVYIDATGDGDLAVMAGADFAYGDETGAAMPATLCSLWGGIDFAARSGRRDETFLPQAMQDGVFSHDDRHLPGIYQTNEKSGIGGGNVGHCFGANGTDERSLTEAMIYGRKSMEEYARFYRKYVPGFENASLAVTANMLGVRESRRIVCDYTLTGSDFLARAVFDDEIGRYCYRADIHTMRPTAQAHAEMEREMAAYTFSEGESYGIPYRTLCVKGVKNMLVAGRCIDTDRLMQSSVRVMPGCYITGQAAGVAAALAAERAGDVRAIEIKQLQQNLLAIGAYLPHAKA